MNKNGTKEKSSSDNITVLTEKIVSQTDWARVDAMTDADIDTSDCPPMTEEMWNRAVIRLPDGTRVPLRRKQTEAVPAPTADIEKPAD